jgi:hypothetical protein
LATVAALGAAAGAVQAQGAAPGTSYGHSHDPVAAADKRLARLKADLKITSAQEPAWNAYAGQVRQHAGEMQALHNQMRQQRESASGNARPSAPERVERQAQFARQQAEYLERLAGLTKDLYATLAPEQKTLADQRLGGGGRRHHHRA